MEKGAGVKATIFLLLLGIFIVGGFVLMQQSTRKANKKEETPEIKYEDIRIDPNKDYIYYEDSDRIVDELDIEYKKVVINFKETTGIEESLNKENAELKETLKYDKTLEDESYNKLSNAKFMKYDIFVYDNYISLLVKYYSFNREKNEGLPAYYDSKAFVFNKNTGKLYSDNELLSAFELTEKDMNEMIKDTIDGEALVREDEELDSNATLKAITDPTIYIDKIGRLTVSVLVKSDKVDYNEDIILN